MKFTEGQLVTRKGYTSKPFIVLGYNIPGMVIVSPTQSDFSLAERTLFLESDLEDATPSKKEVNKMDHPQIVKAMQTGYPTQEHSDWEMNNEVEDHPTEDFMGTEIQPGDSYFVDPQGRVIWACNIEDYLIEILECQVFTAKK